MLEYRWKRLLSGLLALVLVVGMFPAPAFATETEPETQPTVVEETTAESTAPETESVPENTETVTLPEESTEESVPEESTEPEASAEATEVTVPETTEETIAETTEATLPESVQAVQARIDALPTADTVTAEDYDAVQDAYDAYDALTEEEKALIQGAEVFEALFTWFNAQTATLEDNSCGENLTWTLVDGTLTISGTGDMADYYADEVPWNAQCDSITSVVIGEGVTRIGNYAFYGCENLTSVTIPQGVTAIGQSAFTRCSKLNTITIPDSVTQIGAYAFRECGLTSVTLPQGVTSIGNGTFYNCNKLRTVSIPESVTQIGEFAFYGCALTSVTLPQGITSIAKYTFQYNRNLESITIPASVTAIGESAFDGCYHIEDVYYGADGLSWWRNIKVGEYNGYLTRATLHTVEEEGILLTGVCGEELTFALTKEGDLTISGTGAMTAYDWNNCAPWHGYVYDGIKSVTISEGVTTVSDNAFEYCYQLATLTLPESLTSIGSRGFFGCSHLGSVTIPAGVTEIGDGAFASCSDLAAITVAAGNTAYVAVNNLLYDIGKATLMQAPGAIAGDVTVPEGVTTIGTYVFSGCQYLTGVTLPQGLETIQGHAFDQCYDLADAAIPDSVTYIGDFAFSGCRSLTDVAIPSGVTYIGENAFISCSGLTSITLPDGLREIGGGAFYNCSGLTGTITIPKSVTTIGNSAFYGCDNLAAFLVIEENESFASQDGILYNAAKTELIQAPGAIAGDVTIPEGVTSIGYSAFNGRSFLTGIALPSTLMEIGSEAFAYCDSLTKITVAEGNEAFASVNGILYNKNKTEFICIPAGISGEITVPEGITSISSSTFRGCEKITAISLPASVRSIRSSAFVSCTGLESITVAEDNETYCSVDGILYNKDKTELLCVPAGVTGTITIPDGIPSIEEDTFSGCAKITAITIPTSVTFIAPWSLYDCESLTDIYYLGSGAQWEQLAANIEDYQIHYAKVHTMEAEGVLLTGTCGDELNYTLTQDYELIITGSGDMKNFEYVNDVPWYDYAEQITSISLPEGLTSISKNAFHMCQNLTSITIPSTVTTIGAYAFEWCWLEETITIPASVSYIGEGAFVGVGSLAVEGDNPYFTADSKGVLYNKDKTELLQAPYLISDTYTIPGTVTKIWPYAFYNCYSITAVTIPDSVTEIGDRAFSYCEKLTSITVPKSVATIGEGAFRGGGLTKIQVAAGNPNYASVNGMLTNKAKTTLLAVPGGLTGTLAVPSGITTIGEGAFSNSNLTGVTLPSSVTTIGDDAFFGCWNLSSITLPSSVTSLGSYAFGYCRNLTSITIPNGVTSLSDWMFASCTSLNRIALPDTITYIGYEVFGESGLTDIYYAGNEMQWSKISINDYTILGSGTVTIHYGEKLPNYTAKGTCGDDLTWILKDGTLTISGTGAMTDFDYDYDAAVPLTPWYKYRSLIKKLVIEKGVTTIGDEAFDGCYNLTSVSMPDTVTSIGGYAFQACENLKTITIPKKVESIGFAAFFECFGLTSFKVASGNTSFKVSSNLLMTYDGKTVVAAPTGGISGSVTVPKGVTTIGDYAFNSCNGLTQITLPEGLTTIGNNGISNCPNLTSIVLPNSVTSLDLGAFYNIGVTTMVIPGNVTEISPWLFEACSALTWVALPAGITEIWEGAFSGCDNLTDVYYAGTQEQWDAIPIGDGNTCLADVTIHYGEGAPDYIAKGTCGEDLTWILKDGTLTISGTGAMTDFDYDYDAEIPLTPWYKHRDLIKKLVIEKGVTTIGEEAFDGCYNLTSVSMPDTLTSIGIWAFQACESLKTITIPKNVTSIGDGAFGGCCNLTAFKVASGNTSFKASNGILMTADGKTVVSVAGGLTGKVAVPKGVITISGYAFSSCWDITGVTLPEGLTTIGEGGFWDCVSLTSITIPNSVTSIGNSAFYNCNNLTGIVIPAGITTIGDGTFCRCESLTTVTIPSGVTAIGYVAFSGCGSLTSVIIPQSVTSIDDSAFYKCGSLTNVYYAGSEEQWGRIEISDYNECLTGATFHFDSLGSLEIRPTDLTQLISGQSQTLTAYDSITGKKATVTWRVDNSNAATITSAGKLTAKAVDTATTVTVTATDKTGAAGGQIITILPKVSAVTIGEVESTKVDMHVTPTLSLTATTAPADALDKVNWTSSNKSVATVDKTGVVTLLKPGTVTITATATDGSKKSDKVKLTVYYVDTASKLTAKANIPAIGLQIGKTASLTVKGTNDLPAELLNVTSSNPNVASVEMDESGNWIVVGGDKAGTATITASIAGDPLKRKATLKVKIIAKQVQALSLTPSFVDELANVEGDGEPMVILDAENVKAGTYTFTITPAALDYNDEPLTTAVTWTSGNTAIATVKANKDGTATVTVKKGTSGECAITATAKDLNKVTATLWLSVRDYAPRLETTSPAMNLYKSSQVDVALLTSYENGIENVSLYEKEEISQHFTAAWADDTLTITALEGVKKGTYTQTLKVDCANGETYNYTLKIKVTETAPTVTVKQSGKYNLFYNDGIATLNVTVKGEVVENVTVLKGDFSGAFENGTLTLTANSEGAPGKEVKLEIEVEGYKKKVKKTVTLATVTTAPKLKLSATSSTINTALSADCSTSFQVLSGTDVLPLEETDITYSGSFATHTVANDTITLTLDGTKGGTATLNIQKSNWTKAVKLTHKVTVQTAMPTLKLASTTLKLNSVFPDVAAETTVSLSQANLALTDVVITTKTSGLEDVLSVTYDSGKITAKITGPVKAGTYSYTCTGYIGETPLKAVTLKVTVSATNPKVKLASTTFKLNKALAGKETVSTKVTVPAGYTLVGFDSTGGYFTYENGYLTAMLGEEDAGGSYTLYPILKPDGSEKAETLSTGIKVKVTTYSAKVTATVTAKGKLDTMNQDSAITYTVKLKNCAGTISDDISLSGQDKDLFEAKVQDGKVTVTMKADEEYATNKTYKVTLNMVACGQDVSANISFKVTQSTLKVTATPSTLTCYQAIGYGATTLKLTSPATAEFETVALGSKTTAAFQKALGEDGLTFHPETGRITFRLAHPGLLAPGKSYTLYLDVTPKYNATNVKPTQVKLTIKVQK